MSTDLIQTLVLIGIGAGVLNLLLAGGGSLSFWVLLSLGIPPLTANACNLVAMPGSFVEVIRAALWKRWRARRGRRVEVAVSVGPVGHVGPQLSTVPKRRTGDGVLFVAGVVGSGLGAGLVVLVGDAVFRWLAPLLIVVSAVAIMVHPLVKRYGQRRQAETVVGGDQRPASVVDQTASASSSQLIAGVFGASVYAGGFGAGFGTLLLAALLWWSTRTWKPAMVTKNRISMATSLVGAGVYAFSGLVLWEHAMWLAIGMAIGSLLSPTLRNILPETVLRFGVVGFSAWVAFKLVTGL